MMMTAMAASCFEGGLQICKGRLRAGNIAGLDVADQGLVIGIRLGVVAKGLGA